jgi:SAM-dependent methyltransferase
MYSRYLRDKFGDRYIAHDAGPMPPPELIETEALLHAGDLEVRAKPAWYFGSGRRELWTVLTMVEQYGFDPARMSDVLEFGCGSGRVVRHLRGITGLRVAGADANTRAIEWNCKNLSGIDFRANDLEPPLSFPDSSFDLVYALSVFTHIPLQWQQRWLQELRRVLRPNGYLLVTVHGDWEINSQLNDSDRVQLRQAGELTLDAKNARASFSTQVLGSWDVFQTREQVRKTFEEVFEILCYTTEGVAAGQATLVLRR